MKISEERTGNVVVVRTDGRIDMGSSPELEQSIRGLLDSGASRLVVDLTGTDYISSAGLRVLLMAVKALRGSGGKMALAGLNPSVRHILQLAGFLAIFTVEPDAAAAAARMDAEG